MAQRLQLRNLGLCHLLVGLLAAGLGVLPGGAAPDALAPPLPLLQVPLQGSTRPVIGTLAGAAPDADFAFVPADSAQALLLDAAASRLSYPLSVDPRRGSVSFRFKVNRLPGENVKSIPFLQLGEMLHVGVQTNGAKSLILFANEYRTRLAKADRAAAWSSGWHSAVFTWTGTWLHWFVDGEELPTLLAGGGEWDAERAITGRLASAFAVPKNGVACRFRDTAGAVALQNLVVYPWALTQADARQLHAGLVPDRLIPASPTLDVLWAPGEKRVDLIVDAAPSLLATASVEVAVLNRKGTSIARAVIASSPGGQGSACFDVPAFDSGTYRVKVELKDAGGRTIGSATSAPYALERSAYPWLWNDIGRTTDVPTPWTAVTIDGATAAVWGRSYELGVLGLPATVTAAGQPLLAAPVRLVGETSAGPIAWTAGKRARWTRSQPRAALRQSTAASDELNAAMDTTIEFDGNLSCLLTLTPAQPATPLVLTSLALEIPLRPEHAILMHALGPNGVFAGFVPAGENKVWDCFAMRPAYAKDSWSSPFIWLGDDDQGLAWYSDSDEGCALAAASPNLEVIRRPTEVVLRVQLVNMPVTLGEPRRIRFGFMATPVKPLPPRWRAIELGGTQVQDGKNYWWWWPGGAGRRVEGWAGFLPYPTPEDEAVKQVEALRNDGKMAVPFINAHYTGGLPAAEFWEELRRFPEGGLVYQNETRAFVDYNLFYLNRWCQGPGAIDGVYVDESYLCGAERNPLGGMGYYDASGTVRPGSGMLRVRDYFSRLYSMFQANGRDGFIWQHATNFHVPMIASFAGTTCDGENDLASATDDYVDHLLAPELPGRSDFKGRIGRLRAISRSQNFGVPGSYLRYPSPPNDPALIAQHAAVMGLCDIIPVQEPDEFRRVKQEFDIGAADVLFRPFWDNPSPLQVVPATVLVSQYHRPDRDLFYVVNSERKPVTATLAIAPDAGVSFVGRRVYDPFSRETYALEGRTIRVALDSHGYRLVMIAPPPAARAPAGICFAADFNGTLTAAAARGISIGWGTGGKHEFAAGRRAGKQGLLLGREQGQVSYAGTDNVDPLTGSVQFWFKLRKERPDWFQFLSIPAGAGIQFGLSKFGPFTIQLNISPRWQPSSTPQPALAVGEWHHVAVTWEEGRHFRMYLDGALTDDLRLPDNATLLSAAAPGSILLGSAPRSNDQTSDMVLDELTIYDHVLADAEIRQLAR